MRQAYTPRLKDDRFPAGAGDGRSGSGLRPGIRYAEPRGLTALSRKLPAGAVQQDALSVAGGHDHATVRKTVTEIHLRPCARLLSGRVFQTYLAPETAFFVLRIAEFFE